MKIALFLPNWIGDVVMATPAIRAVRERYPTSEIVGVCKPYVADVVAGSPWFDRIVPLDSKGPMRGHWPAVAWNLRSWRPDVSILYANTFRSALVAWLARSGRRIGFVRHGRALMLTTALHGRVDSTGRLVPSPAIDDYNRLAVAADTPDPGHRMQLFTTPTDETAADRILEGFGFRSNRELICLNPGAAFGASKHWSVESFARLTQELIDERGAQILVLCGPSERDMARQIVRLAGRPMTASLADASVSLGLTKALVRRSTLLITTDSGPRHFAAAFDRPVVTLFGPTHIAWTETYFAKAIHLQKKVPCGPCQKRVCPLDHRCMTELSPDEVFAAACQLLEANQRVAS